MSPIYCSTPANRWTLSLDLQFIKPAVALSSFKLRQVCEGSKVSVNIVTYSQLDHRKWQCECCREGHLTWESVEGGHSVNWKVSAPSQRTVTTHVPLRNIGQNFPFFRNV